MSTGTNQQRITQNNQKIDDIIAIANNLPDASGDVKLFETVEEMQQDPNPQDGDLALVYREELQAVDGDTEFDSCIFPNEVVLDEAYTNELWTSFRSTEATASYFDAMVNVTQDTFRFSIYSEELELNITYTSSDGITYTRTDGGEELQEFGTTIKWEDYGDPFDDVISNFMFINSGILNGLYKYSNHSTDDYLGIDIGQIEITENTINIPLTGIKLTPTLYINLVDELLDSGLNSAFNHNNDFYFTIFINKTQSLIYFYHTGSVYFKQNNNTFIINSSGLNTDPYCYIYDVDQETFSKTALTETSISQYYNLINNDVYLLGNLHSYQNEITNTGSYIEYSNSAGTITKQTSATYKYYQFDYILAPTQLTLSFTDELFNGKVGYGKSGEIIGTLGTPDNTFADKNAELYVNIMNTYENMTPRVLTDQDKLIDKNIRIIPVKSDGTPLLDTSNVTDMSNMFEYCTQLDAIPLLDTSNVTDMSNTFCGCYKVTEIPLLDTSNVTNMSLTFANTNITTLPLLDTSNVTDMGSMLLSCHNLTTIPLLDTSSVVDMYQVFDYCTNLISIPQLDTSNVKNMGGLFRNCTNLVTVPILNTSKVTNFWGTFEACPNLSNETLNNILRMCINATNYTGSKYLSYLGLNSTQRTTCQTLSNYQEYLAAGWREY